MIIAVLVALGVSLWVVVALVGLMVHRRRWLQRQPGAFPCAIRSVKGDTPRVGGRRWRRGWGRRYDGLLAWDPMPTLVGSSLLDVIDVVDSRPAHAGEIRRMGDQPMILELALAGGGTVALAVRAEHAALAQRRAAPLAG
jgi:Protein of unknown function (DUF2550)